MSNYFDDLSRMITHCNSMYVLDLPSKNNIKKNKSFLTNYFNRDTIKFENWSMYW